MSPLSIAPWAIAAVLAAGGFAYVVHCNNNAKFITAQKVQAEQQVQALEQKAKRDLKAKEETDAQAAKDHAALQRTISRLRDERARASSVPPAPAGASRPELACFDRAELTRAVGNLEAGMEGLLAEGAAAVLELDAARAWALKLTYQLDPQRLAYASLTEP